MKRVNHFLNCVTFESLEAFDNFLLKIAAIFFREIATCEVWAVEKIELSTSLTENEQGKEEHGEKN